MREFIGRLVGQWKAYRDERRKRAAQARLANWKRVQEAKA